jgi:3-oxoacyl-[acyl-carrier-protein] synthase III
MGMAIIGCGSAAPQAILTNQHLSQIVETSDEWISSRTGMKCRHISSATESLSQLSAEAAQKAISMAGLTPTEVDLIILATSTPDDLFGSASKVQHLIGATRAVAFDLTAACSGFVFSIYPYWNVSECGSNWSRCSISLARLDRSDYLRFVW